MHILKIILPVFTMMILGMVFNRTKFLSAEGIENIKKLVTRIMLPAAIFHALATTSFSMGIVAVIAIMFLSLVVSFALGYALKPLMFRDKRRYLPFMVSVYEGGMVGYPLFISLAGAENLSNIAIVDIAGLLFGFSIYMSLLAQVDEPVKITPKKIIDDALKSPAFIATVLGIMAGATGISRFLVDSRITPVYTAIKDMVVASLNAMILIVVGYNLRPEKKLLRPCLRTIALRVAVQAAMIALVLGLSHLAGIRKPMMDLAIVLYMSAPCTFSMQSFMKSEEGSVYVSTTNSLYCLVSVAVYTFMAFRM